MDQSSSWSLAPAFDIAYGYNPTGDWTSQHQMSLAGLRDNFTLDALIDGGKSAGVSPRAVKAIVREVTEAVGQWRMIANDIGVPADFVHDVETNLRLDIR